MYKAIPSNWLEFTHVLTYIVIVSTKSFISIMVVLFLTIYMHMYTNLYFKNQLSSHTTHLIILECVRKPTSGFNVFFSFKNN